MSMQKVRKVSTQGFPNGGVQAQMVWHMAAESGLQACTHFSRQAVTGLGQATAVPFPPPRAGDADCTSRMATNTTEATIFSAEAAAIGPVS